MEHLGLKPGHAAVKAYYRVLGQYGQLHIDHELAVRSAFQDLLSGTHIAVPFSVAPDLQPPKFLVGSREVSASRTAVPKACVTNTAIRSAEK